MFATDWQRRPHHYSICALLAAVAAWTLDTMPNAGTVTRILQDARSGHRDVVDRLVSMLYDELGRIARAQLRRAPVGATLDTGALIHDAYLRLIGHTGAAWQDRIHFFAYAARAMRSVVLDYARRQQRVKRGGGAMPITLREHDAIVSREADTLIALEDALARLEAAAPRLACIVECRFYGGMSEKETAAFVGVSERTVRRDWIKAKAWLEDALL